ncbi:hypothetical protein H6781_01320 [Candidatus Nomurabacteria bacterium]|nr:hypothetical protein [Candidatus Kaiserbacteria bacterium]MCB9810222.1 hypothetical protein [Candidatus Nomurabacteria bacterium]MCB9818130.1 hypothetical protein [Candidatus Nomurabacteria bacterium]
MKQHSMYHSVLRVSSLVCALLLLFESGIINETTTELSQNTHRYMANAVGMSVGVKPTELNTYTAALTQKERELEAREAALRDREISVNLSTDSNRETDTSTYVLASILFILLVLILLNYSLDYIRAKENQDALPV